MLEEISSKRELEEKIAYEKGLKTASEALASEAYSEGYSDGFDV